MQMFGTQFNKVVERLTLKMIDKFGSFESHWNLDIFIKNLNLMGIEKRMS